MSGTYTIDKTTTASNTNFTSFGAATDSLLSLGLSGNVTINLVVGSGPYTEQLTIPNISGSSIYSLIIDGQNEEINLSDSTIKGDYVVALDNAKNTTLKNLVVRGMSFTKTPTGIEIKNECDNITIEGCKIYCPKNSNYNYYHTEGIMIADHVNMHNSKGDPNYKNEAHRTTLTEGNSTNILIKDNEIYDAMLGIIAKYTITHTGVNIIENNTVVDFAYIGIFCSGGNDIIRNNDISRPNFAGINFHDESIIGISGSGSNSSGTMIISHNHIHTILGETVSPRTWRRRGIISTGEGHTPFYFCHGPTKYDIEVTKNIIDFNDLGFGFSIFTGNDGETTINQNVISFKSSTDLRDRVMGIHSISKGKNLWIDRNRIIFNLSGRTYSNWSKITGIHAIGQKEFISITNNIVSMDITGTKIPFPDDTTPIFKKRLNGLEGINSRGNTSTISEIIYNTVNVNHNTDSTLNSVAIQLGEGHHTVTNNIASFFDLEAMGTFIETDEITTWTATRNSLYFDDSLIFNQANESRSTTYTLTDFNNVSSGYNIVENPNYIDRFKGDFRPQNLAVLNHGIPLVYIPTDYFGSTRSITPDIGAIELKGDNPLGIRPIDNKDQMIIYPNPSTGLFTFGDFKEGSSASVFNTNGQLIHESKSETFNLTGFIPGVYFIKIYTDNSILYKKVILE